MPNLPQAVVFSRLHTDNPILEKWSNGVTQEMKRVLEQAFQTVNALSMVDTIANRTSAPDLNDTIYTAQDTGVVFIGNQGVWETLTGFNGTIKSITNTDSPYTVTYKDSVVLADATGGNITVATPAASTCTGRVWTVKKTDASANTVTIDPNGAETIDGAATRLLAIQYTAVMFVSNGTNWFVV